MITVVEITKWGIPDAYPVGMYPGGNLFKGGHHCCLGFTTVQAGVPLERVENKAFPSSCGPGTRNNFPDLQAFIGESGANSTLTRAAVGVNDDANINWHKRAYALCSLFASHDQELQFTFNGTDVTQSIMSGKTLLVREINNYFRRKRDNYKRRMKRSSASVKAAEDAGLFPSNPSEVL